MSSMKLDPHTDGQYRPIHRHAMHATELVAAINVIIDKTIELMSLLLVLLSLHYSSQLGLLYKNANSNSSVVGREMLSYNGGE